MITVEPIFFSTLPDKISSIWNSLLEQSPSPNFQYEFPYMQAWSQYLREDWKPFLLLVKENDNVKGIFPLMYQDEKRRGILPYRRIKFLGYTFTDFSTILAAEKDLATVTTAALEWLFSEKLRWELLILDDLIEGNSVINTLQTWLNKNIKTYNEHIGKYYYINLQRDWQDIWLETSKKFVRRSLSLAKNRINKAGTWKVVINPNWQAEKIISTASTMHIERQNDLNRDSFYNEQNFQKFLKNIIEHNQARFNSYWLKFEETYIAYYLHFEQDEISYCWNSAFHPDYANFYPSRLLLFHALQDCHNRKLKEFNFMRGEAEYKLKWTKQFRGNYRFTIKNTNHQYGKIISSLEKRL
jgi:CelD/BcsL family acetyltransferase involved in cellulose biosynthesis